MNDIPPPPPSAPPPAPLVPPPVVAVTDSAADEKLWGMLAHLSALSGLVTGGIGNVVGPLIVWQVKKDTLPFAAEEAKEALNFNLSWMLWGVALCSVAFILSFLIIGLFLWPVIGILSVVWIVLSIVAGLRANEGRPYRYPVTIRFIR